MFYDLMCGLKIVGETLDAGYENVCVLYDSKSGKKDREFIQKKYPQTLAGTCIDKDIVRNCKKAIEVFDLVFVDGSKADNLRSASETWETDLVYDGEMNDMRDPLYHAASGLDHTICSFMFERDIGYVFNMGNLLNSSGMARIKTLSRLRQNVVLTRKFNVKTILTMGAKDSYGIRNPHDLLNLGKAIGFTESEALKSITKNPRHYMERAFDRSNPNIIMKGVKVLEWGKQDIQPNKKFGWY